MAHNLTDYRDGSILAPRYSPELFPEVQVERRHSACSFCSLHRFDDQLAGSLRQRRENTSTVEPADAGGEDCGPIEIAGLEQRPGFACTVVEDHWSTHTVTAVAIHGGHIRTGNAVVIEPLVEGLHAHGSDALRDQVSDGVVDHRCCDAGLKAEAIGKIGRDVKLAATNMDAALGRFSEWDDAGVEPVYQRTQRKKIECAFSANIQTVFHRLD